MNTQGEIPGSRLQRRGLKGLIYRRERERERSFFFTQNFFEKNIFFSLKPLDKIEKVWYNIYTEKKNPRNTGKP